MGACVIQIDRSGMMALRQRPRTTEARKTPPYVTYQIKTRDRVITAYGSGKPVFQGGGVEECAALIAPSVIQKMQSGTTAKKTQGQPRTIHLQADSDEVGTGDYLGPVTAYVTCVRHEDVEFLRSLGIQDSKVIDDAAIRCMVPEPMERLFHSLLILDNATCNRIHGKNSMVAIKSRMYSQAYVHLRKKMGSLPQLCIIGRFVQKTSYYRYLKHERGVVYNIHFEARAENKYLSAAVGSITARYASLKASDAMCEQYDFTSLKGAGSKVDQNIREFVVMHGKGALLQIAELHSANTKKALG